VLARPAVVGQEPVAEAHSVRLGPAQVSLGVVDGFPSPERDVKSSAHPEAYPASGQPVLPVPVAARRMVARERLPPDPDARNSEVPEDGLT
jgi:hypothetical protein